MLIVLPARATLSAWLFAPAAGATIWAARLLPPRWPKAFEVSTTVPGLLARRLVGERAGDRQVVGVEAVDVRSRRVALVAEHRLRLALVARRLLRQLDRPAEMFGNSAARSRIFLYASAPSL